MSLLRKEFIRIIEDFGYERWCSDSDEFWQHKDHAYLHVKTRLASGPNFKTMHFGCNMSFNAENRTFKYERSNGKIIYNCLGRQGL